MCLLFVTHCCNLNCVYCYEKFKDAQRMSMETAQRILTEEIRSFEAQGRSGKLTIDFMGGEPMLNFELIREICEWLWRDYPDAPYYLTMRTNGTSLTEESMAWLSQNRTRIDVGLSLDGTEELQNINRSGSSTRIPLEFFLTHWPHLPFKATISPSGLGLLASSAINFYERGIPFSLTLAQGVEWGNDAPEQFREQLMILADYYITHPEITPEPSLFVDDFRNLTQPYDEPFPMCGTRGEMVAYTADGKRSICHLFTEATVGPKRAEEYRSKSDYPKTLPSDPTCTECHARNICKMCPGFNISATGELHIRDKRVCSMMESVIDANCVYYLGKHAHRAFEDDLDPIEAQQIHWAVERIESRGLLNH